MGRKLLLVGGIVGVLAVVLLVVLSAPNDRQLIQEAIDESIQASQEGKPGGVLEYLSNSLTYNNVPAGNRREIGEFIKTFKPKVTVLEPEPTIDGNTATIVSPVELALGVGPISKPFTIEQVRITLRKETGTRYGILPWAKWRVSDVVAEKFDPQMLMGIGGF